MKTVDLWIAAVGGVGSNLLVRMPLGWRLAVMRAGNTTLAQLMKTQAFRKLYISQNKAHSRGLETVDTDHSLTSIPDGQCQHVTLFFSGGADSTYCATLLAEHFDQVHLLTFTHDGIANTHKPKINADRLRERYGERIVFRAIDSNEIWRRLYLEHFSQDRSKYGAFLNSTACECCFLSWNAIAAVYNQRNGISNLAAGIDVDHSGFLYSAHDEGIEVIRRFHAGYGVHFFLPVFNEPAPDVKLYEMGITSEKHTKRPYQFYTTTTTQATCEFGLGHRLFAQYSVVRHPLEERQARARDYFSEKLEICADYVGEVLAANSPLPITAQ
jgi:hypothetical protein